MDQKKSLYCKHLENGQKAANAKEYADTIHVQINDLQKLLKNPDDLKVFKNASHEGKICVFVLPGDNLVVPTFSPPGHEIPLDLVHIRNSTCHLNSCKEKKSKLHTLTSKDQPLCLHTILAHAVKNPSSISTNTHSDKVSVKKVNKEKISVPKINRELSINEVVSQIKDHFPSMTSIRSDFLSQSRTFTEKLFRSPNKNQVIKDHTAKYCKFCTETLLLDWPFQAKKAFLFSMGHMATIEVPLKVCPKCRRAFYPGNIPNLASRAHHHTFYLIS